MSESSGTSESPGRLIGVGRAADVYDQGDGTVLRRYRTDRDTELEGRMMRWLGEHGVPVPVIHAARGPEIVMELVEGPTMWEDLEHRPWQLLAHARRLAALQTQINALVAPEWFPHRDGVTPGVAVLHLDLHPLNVILGPRGPVVIDWTNTARGAATFDAAVSYVLMSAAEIDGRIDRIGRRLLVERFALARGRQSIRASLADAVRHRLRDPNTTPRERASLQRMIARTR